MRVRREMWSGAHIMSSAVLVIVTQFVITQGIGEVSGEENAVPTLLTNLIKSGRINKARELAYVTRMQVKGYSGFLTVNETYNSNLFFWYIPTTLKRRKGRRVYIEEVPLILWLQGGPGTSSLFGLFVENGPFRIDSKLNMDLRDYAWTNTHSMLYIDSPVGTGFSYTNNELGYAKTEDDVALNLHFALVQFFQLFPELSKTDFYIAGESYAGKYIPMLSMKIHNENKFAHKENFINLKGLAIGGGFCDPINMVTSYADYLYFTGLIDDKSQRHFRKQGLLTQQLILNKNYTGAYIIQDELFGGDFLSHPTYFKNKTGFDYYHNILESDIPEEPDYYDEFIQLPKIRSQIHVGQSLPFNRQSEIVAVKLKSEIFKSVRPTVEQLLNLGYQILLYVGQLDIVIPHVAVTNFISHLNWDGKYGYSEAERKILRNKDDEILGYLQQHENLNYVMVRNAGHHVPYDQPKWSLELISRFTRGSLK